MQERNRQTPACTVVDCRMLKIAVTSSWYSREFFQCAPIVSRFHVLFSSDRGNHDDFDLQWNKNSHIGASLNCREEHNEKSGNCASYRNSILLCHHHIILVYDFNFTTTRRTIGRDNKKKLRRSTTQRRKKRSDENFTIQAFLIFMKMINWTLEGISIYCNSSLVSHELWWITFSRYNVFIYCKTHDASSEPHETQNGVVWTSFLRRRAATKKNVK